MTKQLVINPTSQGMRLDVWLTEELAGSRSSWQHHIRQGHVLVNGQPQKTGYLLAAGDKISLSLPDKTYAIPEVPDLAVLYEDDKLIVINKPAGILVHDIQGHEGREATVAAFANARGNDLDPGRPGIVHRLDKDTSGVMLLAKDETTKEFLQDQFRSREVKKTYLALIVGRPRDDEALIDLPIGRDPKNPLKRSVQQSGKPAITAYRAVAHFISYTLIEAYPQTGRTHQIRAHFSHLGHPIAGDVFYGGATKGLKRQFLHASQLEFTHPNGQKLSFEAALPKDLADFLKALE